MRPIPTTLQFTFHLPSLYAIYNGLHLSNLPSLLHNCVHIYATLHTSTGKIASKNHLIGPFIDPSCRNERRPKHKVDTTSGQTLRERYSSKLNKTDLKRPESTTRTLITRYKPVRIDWSWMLDSIFSELLESIGVASRSRLAGLEIDRRNSIRAHQSVQVPAHLTGIFFLRTSIFPPRIWRC